VSHCGYGVCPVIVHGQSDQQCTVDWESFDLATDEDPILLPELGTSDLEKLTDCLDILVDTELMAKTRYFDSVTDVNATCLDGDIDAVMEYTFDSGVSVDQCAAGLLNSTYPVSNEQLVLQVNESALSYNQIMVEPEDFIRCPGRDSSPGGGDSWVESLVCSPSSTSSGCESDLSSWTDDQIPYSDDNGLFDSCDDPFNDLFPELF